MRSFPLMLSVGLSLGLVAASIAQPPDADRARRLTPVEEAVAADPFPPERASVRLEQTILAGRQYRRQLALLPPGKRPKTPDDGGMGWAIPDDEYWKTIPVEARSIPIDWSALPYVRFTNTQIDGQRDVRLSVQGDYDLWLLSDPLHELTACISVHRPSRRVWFVEIARGPTGEWLPKRAKDPCYSCHPSGPRLIRPLRESGLDRRRIEQFNRRMLGYGACDFGESVNLATRGAPNENDRCSGCHNGVSRGRLYEVHARAIQFKTDQDWTMPPGG